MIKWTAQLICGIVRQPRLVANPIANDDFFFSEVFWECSLTGIKPSAVKKNYRHRESMDSSSIIPAWDSGQEARRQVANLKSPVQIWAIPLCPQSIYSDALALYFQNKLAWETDASSVGGSLQQGGLVWSRILGS